MFNDSHSSQHESEYESPSYYLTAMTTDDILNLQTMPFLFTQYVNLYQFMNMIHIRGQTVV